MRLGSVLVGAVMSIPAIAAADVVVGPETADGFQLARQVLPASAPAAAEGSTPASALAVSRVVYLNKNGVTLSPGVNDSRINRSTIATQPTTIPPWTVNAATWAATVSCMREIFSPFDITIVDIDPGTTPHIEAVFGGSPTQFGMANNIAGLSPFTADCSTVENSIVFTFTTVTGSDPRLVCEIQAQEVAHSYGLDHVLLASDLMTYLPFTGRRWFQNQNASCGEDKQRPCGLNGSVCRGDQNSVSMLIERVGLKSQAGDTVAPTVTITSPKDGATVPLAFDVSFTAADNAKVTMASLYVDGVPSGTAVLAPFKIPTPKLSEGQHKLRIVATDGKNEKAQEITVNAVKDADPDEGTSGGCTAGGGSSGASLSLVLLVLGALVRRRRH